MSRLLPFWVVLALSCSGCARSCGGEASQPDADRPRPAEAGPGLSPWPPGDGDDLVVDPYCGMRLRRSEAAATHDHRRQTYYFCLVDHRDAFARDPDRYLADTQGDDGPGSADADLDRGASERDGLSSSPDGG